MATIFDYVTSANIVSYWNSLQERQAENLLGEELFPAAQKRGLKLDWIYGAGGLPVVLLPSAYDVVALKRDRIGFSEVSTKMPFFKESMYIDEELRQELNMVLETGNRKYINMVMNNIMKDTTVLLAGAKAQRERMRMMLLTTGGISIAANGQNYDYDYGMKDYQKVTVKKSWSDPKASILEDIEEWQGAIEDVTGVKPTRAVVSAKTYNYFRNNEELKYWHFRNTINAPISTQEALAVIKKEKDLTIVKYPNKYVDETGAVKQYVPDDTLSMFPAGPLGTSWFGTTPEQSDLMSGSAANVTITDTGVAVTTSKKVDPVNVDTKVSMIFLPSFEQISNVIIADLKADESAG